MANRVVSMAQPTEFRFGSARYFVPICIRHSHGFYGGPAGYQEMTRQLAKAFSPIIIETPDEQIYGNQMPQL